MEWHELNPVRAIFRGLSAIYAARANMSFLRRNYGDALRQLNRICKWNPELKRKTLVNLMLGSSYYEVGNMVSAKKSLGTAFQLYKASPHEIPAWPLEEAQCFEKYVRLLDSPGEKDLVDEVRAVISRLRENPSKN